LLALAGVPLVRVGRGEGVGDTDTPGAGELDQLVGPGGIELRVDHLEPAGEITQLGDREPVFDSGLEHELDAEPFGMWDVSLERRRGSYRVPVANRASTSACVVERRAPSLVSESSKEDGGSQSGLDEFAVGLAWSIS
jgi:hypothetical protein